jgi:hypothetical protein
MGISAGPSAVSDGLVFQLDAANLRSYSGFGNTANGLISGIGGTLVNGIGFSSANNGSFFFDGTNDYISVSHSSVLTPSDNFSVSFWINQKRAAPGLEVPLSKYGGTDNGWLFVIDNYTMGFDGRNGTNQYQRAASSVPMTLNTWYFFVGIKNGTNMSIYQNGTLTGSYTWSTSGVLATSLRDFIIGQSNGAYYTNSNISQVSMYNRPLSATEVMQNFNAMRERYNL